MVMLNTVKLSVVKWMRFFALCALLQLLQGCQTHQPPVTLYEELGGKAAIEKITGNFIAQIGFSPSIAKHFEESDLDRFYEKVVEHFCEISDGPCTYSGDSMEDVHAGMGINEAEFNMVVDLLIAAMNQSGIAHPVQNKLLKRLAPMRAHIIYR